MEIGIIIIGFILLISGFIGCFIPVIPGPPISFLSLVLIHFCSKKIDLLMLFIVFIIVLIVTFLDYFLQVYGVKKIGGGRLAVTGSIIGLIIGIIFIPPFGIIIGSFLGAYIGSIIETKGVNSTIPIRVAFGALLGFLGGTFLKVLLSFYITFLFVYHIFYL